MPDTILNWNDLDRQRNHHNFTGYLCVLSIVFTLFRLAHGFRGCFMKIFLTNSYGIVVVIDVC